MGESILEEPENNNVTESSYASENTLTEKTVC